MAAYYNEHDPYAAEWLRNLIKAGHIAPGVVDERSIEDVRPDELSGFTQCHFFAGVGVWSYALRRAGWPDDRPAWTGSCPCQPFSAAGKRKVVDDERHLWPAFQWLIQQCSPELVLGEQVASKDGLAWLDLVQADMENTGYAVGEIDLCAAGFGAPHIRQRSWFIAERLDDTTGTRHNGTVKESKSETRNETRMRVPSEGRGSSGLADTNRAAGRQDAGGTPPHEEAHGRAGRDERESEGDHRLAGDGEVHEPGPTNGFWRDADWLGCRDGKWRPAQPGTFPLAHGITNRVGRLRAYGNAINAEVATEVIRAYIETKI